MFDNTKAVNIIGATKPAILFAIPKTLILAAALSLGPITTTYGLAAVCNIAKPVPMINKAIKNSKKVLLSAAG